VNIYGIVFKSLATRVNQRYKYLKYKGKGRITAEMKLLKSSENRYSAFKILIRNEFKGGN
jgi:hypothetical protein